MDLLDSKLFGERHKPKLLGLGANGLVFRSKDNTAIKVTFLDYEERPEKLQKRMDRVRREYDMLKDKHHENVIKMIACWDATITMTMLNRLTSCCGDLKNAPELLTEQLNKRNRDIERHTTIRAICFEMELCGPTLRDWLNWVQDVLRESSSTLGKIEKFKLYEISSMQASVARGILDALKFLHGNGAGILHRDLKPENIMFSYSQNGGFTLPIKIGDFGLCCKVESDTNNNAFRDGNLSSSPDSSPLSTLYQAPGTTASSYTTKSELHSLGLVLYELLNPMSVEKLRKCFDKLSLNHDYSDLQDHFVLDNVKKLISHLTSKDSPLRRPMNIRDITLNSRAKLATSSGELKRMLLTAAEGELIQIAGGVYLGRFEIKTKGVVLEGGIGGRTILKFKPFPKDSLLPALLISADKCLVTNLSIEVKGSEEQGLLVQYMGVKIKGRENTLHKVCVTHAHKSVRILGSSNVLQECEFLHAVDGVYIKGMGNRINQVRLRNISWYGIDLYGNNNTILDVDCVLVTHGIKIDNGSMRNFIKKFTYIKNPARENVKVVWVRNGENNKISRLHCTNLRRDLEDWGLLTGHLSKGTVVSESHCGAVMAEGEGNVFRSVDFGQIFRGKASRMEGCNLGGIPYP